MDTQPVLAVKNKKLYEAVADQFQQLIAERTLQAGDRLPSVRKLHRQWSVSISTVLEAYRLLEDRGLIEVRPQSGYFVKGTIQNQLDEPSLSAPLSSTQAAETSLVLRINRSMLNPKVVGLGAAITDISLLPIATLNRLMGQVLRAKPAIAHSYLPPQGCEELRHEVARRLLDTGYSATPEQIIITNGTTEALFLSLKAVTKPGDVIAIESPTYHLLIEMLEVLQLRALELPTHPQDGISLIHLEEALQTQKISACVLVANFSNPLGSCMSDAKKKHVIELINRHNVPLIEDDIYGDLNFLGNRPKAIKSFDSKGLVIYCSSISKTLSPGLRVGWVVGGIYQPKIERLKTANNYMTAIAPQLTIAAFFANGGYDRHLRKLRRTYHSQMLSMKQAICDSFPKEARVSRPQGGYVLWIEMPEKIDTLRLYEEALQHNIVIAPGCMFSSSCSYQNCFRLNFGLPFTEEIQTAIHILGQLLHTQMMLD